MLDQLFDDYMDYSHNKGYELGRRLGHVDGDLIFCIGMRRKIDRLMKKLESSSDSQSKKVIRDEINVLNRGLENIFDNKDDMMNFISRYPNSSIESLSRKILYESEYDYFWI